MYKYYLIIFSLISLRLTAQESTAADSIYVDILTPKTTRVVLYAAEGAKQKYIGYDDATDGHFSIAVSSNVPSGVLRLVYNQENMDYVDFLYLKKPLHIRFDDDRADATLLFPDSPENTRYFTTLNKLANTQYILDSLQVTYFKTKDEKQKISLVKQYAAIYQGLQKDLAHFDSVEKDARIKDLIYAGIYSKSPGIIDDPKDYLPYVKAHYFDRLDFANPHLIHSPVLIDKVMDYVFYLTTSPERKQQIQAYISAVTDVLGRIKDDELRAGFIKSLIQSFARDEIVEPVDYLLTEYYDKLPAKYRNDAYRYGIVHDLRAAVGRIAPDITWETEGKKQHLLGLEGAEYYVVVFWSSTCPHCLKAMPKLYEYLKDSHTVKVIMVGLETQETETNWKSESYYYQGFIQVLGMGKWDYKPAQVYNVHATPEYFILDKNKKIIAKPYELEDLKAYFEKELKFDVKQ